MENYKSLPVVSVVIATWNRRMLLKKALLSIVKQTYPRIEIIVVDNHSTDGTYEMIRSEFPDVALIRMPTSNYGLCETVDIGLLSCRGDLILVLDDDAFVDNPETLNEIVKIFSKYPKVGVITLRIKNPDGGEETRKWPSLRVSENEDLWLGNLLHGACFFIRRELVEQGCIYDPKYLIYGNEWDLALKVLNKGYLLGLSKKIKAIHLKQRKTSLSPREIFYRTRNNLYTVWKYYPWQMILSLTTRVLVSYFLVSLRSRNVKNITHFCVAVFSFCKHLRRILKERNVLRNDILTIDKPIVEHNFPPFSERARRVINFVKR